MRRAEYESRWDDRSEPRSYDRWYEAPAPRHSYLRPRIFDRSRRRARDGGPLEERRTGERRQGERRREERRQEERREGWRGRLDELRSGERQRGWVERGKAFLRKYREPVIGLTVAGAAAPLAAQARAPRAAPGTRQAAERMDLSARPGGDVAEDVGERWASSRAEQIREDTIEGAMIRYNIDRSLAEEIYDAAVEEDLDPDIAFGLVNTESAFDPRAISNVGARGLTQVMPRTAKWLRPGTTAEDLFDRTLNLHLGFGYLRDLIDKYDGNVKLALLAYNRGPGTVDRVLSQGGDPDNGYADKVLSG